MAALADVFLRGRLDTTRLKADAEKGISGAGLGKLGEQHGKAFGSSFTSSAGAMMAKVGTLFAVLGAASVFKDSIAEAREAIKVGKLTEAAIKSTGGVAKVSAQQISDLANALSVKVGVDDEAIQSGENLLLTFTNIRNGVGKSNDIFNQASAAVLDMTAAMNNGTVTTDGIKTSTIQLGKALADPIKGITALTRVGVVFSDAQKEQIKGFVAAGNIMGAQKVILAELSKEFGGAAAAAADPAQRAQVAWKNFEEVLGGFVLPALAALLGFLTVRVLPVIQNQIIPRIEELAGWLKLGFIDGGTAAGGFAGVMQNLGHVIAIVWGTVKDFWTGLTQGAGNAAGTAEKLGGVFHDVVIPALMTFVGWIQTAVGWLTSGSDWAGLLRAAIAGAAGAILIAVGVIKIITTAQLLWNLAMSLNPIGLVILAIGALVAGVIFAWTHFAGFRDFLIGAWQIIAGTTLWIWHNVFEPAFHGIATVALWLWQNVLQPTFLGIKFYIENFVMPVIMFLWHNVVEPAFTGIKFAINVAWTAIQIIFAAIRMYVTGILAPLFTWLWRNVVEPVFAGIGAQISFVWNNVIKPVFAIFGTYVRDIVAPAFKAGVHAIEVAWDAVKEAARVPVAFVVNRVINPLIGGFNKVASAFGVKSSVHEIGGFAGGGRIPGSPSAVDNMLAVGPGGMVGVASGEFIVNAEDTSRALPILKWINSGMPGFADGGLVGFLGNIWSAVTDPARLIKAPAEAALRAIPGGGIIRDLAAGAGRQLLDGMLGWIKSKLSSGGPTGAGPGFLPWPGSPGGQRGDSGVWRSIVNLIRSTGPLSGSFGNAYRAGDPLWHGSGRAVDWMGFNQDALANVFMARRGQVLELIHRSGTRDYAVTRGVDKGSFNSSLMEAHRNHIHIAMARGGLIPTMDAGGSWPSGTVRANMSGRTEQVTPGQTMDAVVDRLERLIAAVERVAPGVGAEINGAGRRMVQIARAT